MPEASILVWLSAALLASVVAAGIGRRRARRWQTKSEIPGTVTPNAALTTAGGTPDRTAANGEAWSATRIPTAGPPKPEKLPRERESENVADAAAARPRKTLRLADDAEFLPAALEILETPPSPSATSLMLAICAGLVALLAWSFFGKLDIHAVAQGKIHPSGRTKVVQPLEPGRVAAIWAENGKHVEAGDVLIELDPTETAADLEALERELESTTAEAVRRKAAIASIRAEGNSTPEIAFPDDISAHIRQRETELMLAELAQIRSIMDGVKAQTEEREATKKRLLLSIDTRQRMLELSKERVGMREEITTRGAGSRALIIEAELQYENIRTTNASEQGQLVETEAAIVSLDKRLQQARDQFIAEQAQKGTDADRKRDRLEQELIKARSRRERMRLRAPSAGIVQQLEVSTLGQVVASGQPLASVVPIDATLEVEAMIANRDIGFVRTGQPATVKIDAFAFSRYGTIDAEVVRVSTDAVDDRNATTMMDAASAARPQLSAAPKPASGQSLVFPAVLKLARSSIEIDGKEIALSPGMTVTVEIKTGERRAISYVLSPLSEIMSTTARER